MQGLEREKIENEYNDLMEQIAWFKKILGDESILMNIIKEELLEIKKKYGVKEKNRYSGRCGRYR